MSGEGCWHRSSSSQVCHGSVRGTSAQAGLLFSLAKPLLALFCTPIEEPVAVEGAAGNSQVCSKEQVWVWEFGDCSQTELPSTLASKGRHVLRSTPVQTIPLPDQLLCQPAVTFNVLPR